MNITDKPIVLTPYALVRFLKEFALKMGMHDSFAGTLAQVHVVESQIPLRWDAFIQTNCAQCPFDQESCAFLHPTPEMCRGRARPADLRTANALMVEMGKFQRCPVRDAELGLQGEAETPENPA